MAGGVGLPMGAWQNNTLISKLNGTGHAHGHGTRQPHEAVVGDDGGKAPLETAMPGQPQGDAKAQAPTPVPAPTSALTPALAPAVTSAQAQVQVQAMTKPTSSQFNPNTAPFTPAYGASIPQLVEAPPIRPASVPAQAHAHAQGNAAMGMGVMSGDASTPLRVPSPAVWNTYNPNIWTSNDLPLKMSRNYQLSGSNTAGLSSDMSPVSPGGSMNMSAASAFQTGVWQQQQHQLQLQLQPQQQVPQTTSMDPVLMAAINRNLSMNRNASAMNEYEFTNTDQLYGTTLGYDMPRSHSALGMQKQHQQQPQQYYQPAHNPQRRQQHQHIHAHPQSINIGTLSMPIGPSISSVPKQDDQMSRQESSNGDAKCNKELFKTELCHSFMETGVCRYGAHCQFAHGEHELRSVQRHPKYKTKMCKNFSETGYCPYSQRCRFIHMVGNSNSLEGANDNTTPNKSFTGLDTHALMMMQGLSLNNNQNGGGNGVVNGGATDEDDNGAANDAARSRLPFFVKLEVSSDDEKN